MAKIKNKKDLGLYCLRELGAPVINIEIDETQIEDRIDDALDLYFEKHYDAVEETWLYYSITQTDLDNGYITLPDYIANVLQIGDMSGYASRTGEPMFDLRYQIGSTYFKPFMPMDTVGYYLAMTSLSELNDLFRTGPTFGFTKNMHKLSLYQDFTHFKVGHEIALNVNKLIDPETSNVYNDRWLKKYSTALIKRQWGQNIKKYSGVQLLGGMTTDGKTIFDEAEADVQRLEEELEEVYMAPPRFFMG